LKGLKYEIIDFDNYIKPEYDCINISYYLLETVILRNLILDELHLYKIFTHNVKSQIINMYNDFKDYYYKNINHIFRLRQDELCEDLEKVDIICYGKDGFL
jgi:hypothetical protein